MNDPFIQQAFQSCKDNIVVLEKMCPEAPMQMRLQEIDQKSLAPDLWNNPKLAGELLKERQVLGDFLGFIEEARADIALFAETIWEIDLGTQDIAQLTALQARLQNLVFEKMMSDPVDKAPVILSISAGAGGLESANFVSMLCRMYCRYADAKGFKIEILDEQRSKEHSSICTDNISIRIEGSFAFGFFKGESGVHRLIRNSPFNAGNARQTSFAAVYITPDIEDIIDIKVNENDLEITAQTAGGPGGQAQNRTKSAVRLKHILSGIHIVVRTERSQHDNLRTAMKMLKSQLYEMEMKKRQEEKDKLVAQQSSASFGSQVKTYTMSPYSLVKDHRSGFETNDAEGYLDGDIHQAIVAYLQSKVSATK